MPKVLREPQPTSSVARLFDMGAAARAVATNPPLPAPTEAARPHASEPVRLQAAPTAEVRPMGVWEARPQQALSSAAEQPDVKREFVLTPGTEKAFSRLVELYRRSTGTKLTSSHVARAVFKGIAHCMDSLEREAKRIGPMKLPSNAREKALDRERFEAKLADAFVAGVRGAAAFDAHE